MSGAAEALALMYKDRGLPTTAIGYTERPDPGGDMHEVVYLNLSRLQPGGIQREMAFLTEALPRLDTLRGRIADLDRYRSKQATTTVTYGAVKRRLVHHAGKVRNASRALPRGEGEHLDQLEGLFEEGKGIVRHLRVLERLQRSNDRDVTQAEAAEREYPVLERRIYGAAARLAHAMAVEPMAGLLHDKRADRERTEELMRAARRVLRRLD